MTSILKQMEDDFNFKANGIADEMEMADKQSDHYFRRFWANIAPPHFCFFGKNENCLEFPDFVRKLKNG